MFTGFNLLNSYYYFVLFNSMYTLIYHFTILIPFDTYNCIVLNLIYYYNYLIPFICFSCNALKYKLYF